MYDASHTKAGGDSYGRAAGWHADTADTSYSQADLGTSGFATPEGWSTWPGNLESGSGPNPMGEDTDNTAFGRIDIPV